MEVLRVHTVLRPVQNRAAEAVTEAVLLQGAAVVTEAVAAVVVTEAAARLPDVQVQ